MATYDYIYLNEEALPKPTNFTPAREDVYAGEYTTCTGKMIADRIGWKFSEIDLQWDALKQAVDGVTWWRDVSVQLKFIDTHNE